jgi:hypothetical protein
MMARAARIEIRGARYPEFHERLTAGELFDRSQLDTQG